jgi:hypothetical protein
MGLLTGYALVPCASTAKGDSEHRKEKGVRLTITNTLSAGKKQTHILSPGAGSSTLATAQNLWGSKALESVTEFELSFCVEGPKKRLTASSAPTISSPTNTKYVVRFFHPRKEADYRITWWLPGKSKSKSEVWYPSSPSGVGGQERIDNSFTLTGGPVLWRRFVYSILPSSFTDIGNRRFPLSF